MATAARLNTEQAVTALRDGGVIVYPTEAVWGIGCDPFREDAVMRLLAIKQRTVDKGLILIAASFEQLRPCLDPGALPASTLAQVLATWPGPHTWVMPVAARVPRWVTGEHDSLAVRVTDHPTVIALCRAFGGPIVSTSANLSGQPAVLRYADLDPVLIAQVAGVTEGETGGLSNATPIRDARSGASLRS